MTHPIDTSPEAIAALVDELRTIGCFKNGDARCTCGIGQNAADLIQALTAERDEARAQVAMAYEVAAKLADSHAVELEPKAAKYRKAGNELSEAVFDSAISEANSIAVGIRALTPADATAALAARDAAMRNEGRRQAAEESDYDAGYLNDFGGGDVSWWHDYLRAEIARANDHWRAILAALEPEGGE